MKIVLALLLMAGFFAVGTPNAWASTVTLLRAPSIHNVTPTSLVIVWTTAESGSSEVRYGIGNHDETAVSSSYFLTTSGSSPYDEYYVHETTLSGLTPNTMYQYQIYTDGVNLTPGGSIDLRSGRGPSHNQFRFAALGDSGTGNANQIGVAERLAQVDPDLVLHAGDMNYPTNYNTIETWFFQMYADVVKDAWFAPLAGNHDMQDGGAVLTNSFVVPPNGSSDPIERELYYSFDYGNVHFTMITSELSSGNGSDQYNFLDADLAATSQFWKVVVMHEPAFYTGHGQTFAKRYQNLVELFEQYEVDIVIAGDRHWYERLHPIFEEEITPIEDGGIHHFVTGGGGRGLSPTGSPPYHTVTAEKAGLYHLIMFDVDDCLIEFKSIERTHGSDDDYDPSDIIDSTTIDKCPPTPPADLTISKADAVDPVVAGDDVTYTIQVTNDGPNTSENVVVTDTLPGTVNFVSATPDNGTSCAHDNGTVTCNLGNLNDGDSVDVTVVVTTTAAGTINNSVSVDADTRDNNSSNDSANEETTVSATPPADVGITKTDAVDPVIVGDDVTYTIEVTNYGPNSADNVVVTDTLPGTVNFVSATPDNATSCTHNSGTITCALGPLNNSDVVVITVVVSTTQPGTINNSVTMTSDATDPDSDNNSASEETTVNNVPPSDSELAITKTDNADPVDFGDNIIYTVEVTNNGPEAAKSVVVTDSLPAGLTFVSATADNGGGCSHDSGTISCNLGEIPNGDTVTISIEVTTATGGTVTNNVSVTGNVTDSDSSNDSASEDTTIITYITNYTLNPIHDAYAADGSSREFGVEDEQNLRVRNPDGSSARNVFLKFDVSGVAGVVESATLRLYVNDDSNGVHSIYPVSNNYLDDSGPWTETGINGQNAPQVETTPIDAVAAGARNTWQEFDVTSAVSGSEISLMITSTGGSHYFDSDENTNRPELVIVSNTAPVEEPDIAVSPASLASGQTADSQRTKSVAVANNGDADLTWTTAEAATDACATPSDLAWAALSASSGTRSPSGSDSVDVTFDSTGLTDGTYTGDLCVQSNDPDTPLVQVPLTLDVCTPPSPLTVDGITVAGNTNTVAWTGTATGQFEVWWWGSEFYPVRDVEADCDTVDNCEAVDKSANSFDHTVADNSVNYTYIVVADNLCGPDMVSSANSNVKAEFGYGVVPGS
ncbi:MAG: fibronectin type III domain-containing protein [Chloroflexota bacterium]